MKSDSTCVYSHSFLKERKETVLLGDEDQHHLFYANIKEPSLSIRASLAVRKGRFQVPESFTKRI